MTKVMFILTFVSSGLEFYSVNHTSVNENSELRIFKNIELLEISNIWPNGLFETNFRRLLNHVDNRCWQYYNGLILLH